MSSSGVDSPELRHRRTRSAPLQQSTYHYHLSSNGGYSLSAHKAGFTTPQVHLDQPEFGKWGRHNPTPQDWASPSSSQPSTSSSSPTHPKRKSRSSMSLPSLMDSYNFSDSSSCSSSASTSREASFASSSSSSVDAPYESSHSSQSADETTQHGFSILVASSTSRQNDNLAYDPVSEPYHAASSHKRDTLETIASDALSSIPIRQAISISFYLFLSIITALSLLSILLASYGLTLADDVKVRVGKAVEQATDMKKWAKASALDTFESEPRNKRTSSNGTRTPHSGSSTPSSGTRTPEAREFNDERPSRSISYTILSLASLAIIPFVLKIFGKKRQRRSSFSNSHSSSPADEHRSSSNIPPRPPLKTLIPSIILALMVALLGIITSSTMSQNKPPQTQRGTPPKTRKRRS